MGPLDDPMADDFFIPNPPLIKFNNYLLLNEIELVHIFFHVY